MMTFPSRWLKVLGLFSAFFATAFAHDPFEITTSGRLDGETLQLMVTMTRSTAMSLANGVKEGASFKPEDFPAVEAKLSAVAPSLYTITSNNKVLPLKTASVKLSVEEDVEFLLLYPRPAPGPMRFEASHIFKLPDGYGNAVNLGDTTPPSVLAFQLLTTDVPAVDVVVATPGPAPAAQTASTEPAAGEPSAPPAPPAATAPSPFRTFLKLGVKHILEGYDHLLFLAGLLIATRRVKTMLGIITCFTLAHSLTLALAALDIIAIPSRIVEPLIAASIVFVALENIFYREEPKGRFALTFAFGLIHGFGFASILRDRFAMGADGSSLVVPLFSFNLGVELGQLLVAALVLPLFLKFRENETFNRIGVRAVSAVIAALGAYWMIERLIPLLTRR